MTPLEELVEAWVLWDAAPSVRDRVVGLQEAIRAAGVDSLVLRRRVPEMVREGVPLRDAVVRAVEEQS